MLRKIIDIGADVKKNILSSTVMVLVWWYAEPSLISCALSLEDSPGGGIR